MTFAYKSTKLTLDLATRMIHADVRIHNLDVIKDDMAMVLLGMGIGLNFRIIQKLEPPR